MNYIRITKENIDREHICCAMSGKQSIAKKEWLRQRFEEGLVFYRSEERGKCFIEYIPAENAWVPIMADGWLYINCLWWLCMSCCGLPGLFGRSGCVLSAQCSQRWCRCGRITVRSFIFCFWAHSCWFHCVFWMECCTRRKSNLKWSVRRCSAP